jgi:selenocysteine lyase/cysteine desulfurase
MHERPPAATNECAPGHLRLLESKENARAVSYAGARPESGHAGDKAVLTRRDLLLSAGAVPVLQAAAAVARDSTAVGTNPGVAALPDKAAFLATDITYLDSGSFHPISLGAKAAIETYLARRTLDPAAKSPGVEEEDVLAKFARLVNADRDEVAFVQSTTTGEQMVLKALGIPASGGHIVTDTLHFFGSFPLYEELARQGMEVSWVKQREGRIELDDVRQAVRKGTKLVALSAVSTFNGFEHDLKSVAAIAHEHGALIYADVIHAAGCVPLDLHASGVDFAACASYKWLMGDFGLGFLYVRKGIQPELKRTNYGYYGIGEFKPHVYPLDPPGPSIADYAFQANATGEFALGTHAEVIIAQLNHSLDYIAGLGVENIQAHAQSLTERLKRELPQLGYKLLTPLETRTPLVACLLPDARKRLAPRLKDAKIRLTLAANRFRASVSVFNTMQDIDRMLAVLGHA